MRVPYPLGFYSRGLDGRIDDATAGWKGRGVWASFNTGSTFHPRGRKRGDERDRQVPDPPRSAGELGTLTCAHESWRAVSLWRALGPPCPWLPSERGWSRPFPAHRVIGNLYAVGTYDLAVFLVTSQDGHILINTGLEDSTPMIRENIESLGFRLEDVKILLTMQAHWDHTAALAEIKALTGAEMWATDGDALGTGGRRIQRSALWRPRVVHAGQRGQGHRGGRPDRAG